MPWDRGYYYRSIRRDGKPRREYVGQGVCADLVARMDELQRDKRDSEAAARRAERRELEVLDQPLEELNELADLAAHVALLAAGYRQHHRGEWRKRRDQHNQAGDQTGAVA
jgi:hypothetical protein